MKILLNDAFVPRESFSIDLEDRGYQFGDGIYEVIRFYDGILFEWEAHFERFVRSARELMIPLPVDLDDLYQNLVSLVTESGTADGFVYMQVTRGVAPRAHHFPEKPKPVLVAYVREMMRPEEHLVMGIRAITVEDIRWLRVDIKSLNLLGNVLAKQKAIESDAHEAILVRDGWVTEGSSSNVFAIRGKQCLTHPANRLILNGITRQVVIRLLESTELILQETPFAREELLQMDEVFITSTGDEVCPVVQIDGQLIGNGRPGLYTRQLQSAFKSLIFSFTTTH